MFEKIKFILFLLFIIFIAESKKLKGQLRKNKNLCASLYSPCGLAYTWCCKNLKCDGFFSGYCNPK